MTMTDSLTHSMTLPNKRGIHARSAAKIVQLVEGFNDVEVMIACDGHAVSGQSIMGLLMLGAIHGKTVLITTRGAEKEQALQALIELINNRFGEKE